MISTFSSIPQYVPETIATPFHWVWKQRIYLVKEAAATSLTALFLHSITERYLNHPPKFSSRHPLDELYYLYLKQQKYRQFSFKKIYYSIVYSPFLGDVLFSPFLEEIIFRSFIPKMIAFFQKKMSVNRNHSSLPSEVDHQPGKTFIALHIRVHMSALIFALAHLMKALTLPNTSLRNRRDIIINTCSSYLGGIVSGYLVEKYSLLAPGLLVHGLNNFLALRGKMFQGRLIISPTRGEWYQFRRFWNNLTRDQRSILKWMAVNKIAFLLLGLLPIEKFIFYRGIQR